MQISARPFFSYEALEPLWAPGPVPVPTLRSSELQISKESLSWAPSPEASTAPLSRAGRSLQNTRILEASFFGCSSKRKQILLLLNLISSFLLKDRKIFAEDGNKQQKKHCISLYWPQPKSSSMPNLALLPVIHHDYLSQSQLPTHIQQAFSRAEGLHHKANNHNNSIYSPRPMDNKFLCLTLHQSLRVQGKIQPPSRTWRHLKHLLEFVGMLDDIKITSELILQKQKKGCCFFHDTQSQSLLLKLPPSLREIISRG